MASLVLEDAINLAGYLPRLDRSCYGCWVSSEETGQVGMHLGFCNADDMVDVSFFIPREIEGLTSFENALEEEHVYVSKADRMFLLKELQKQFDYWSRKLQDYANEIG